MTNDVPFHELYLVFCFIMISYRFYYMGYVDASGETVPRLEEGLALRRIRYFLGIPFLLGSLIYLMKPCWMRWSQWEAMPPLLRWVGVLLLAFGIILYVWTHRHLGKNFTDTVYVRKKSTLILDGPYKWVRHPMYVSGMNIALGTFLTTANWFLGVIGFVLMSVIMIWRTPIEEKKLIEKHGAAYKKYMKKTGCYFPRLF